MSPVICPMRVSSLRAHVRHVAGTRAEEKMRRVDATRVVAMMAAVLPSRNGAVGQFVDHPASFDRVTSVAKMRITMRIVRSRSQPARPQFRCMRRHWAVSSHTDPDAFRQRRLWIIESCAASPAAEAPAPARNLAGLHTGRGAAHQADSLNLTLVSGGAAPRVSAGRATELATV